MAQPLTPTEMQSIKELPAAELVARLKGLSAEQLRQLCGVVGTVVRGAKPDMQERIRDKILASRKEMPSDSSLSPQGRDGRHRSPKPGAAATAARAAIASDELAAGQAAGTDSRIQTRASSAAAANSAATKLVADKKASTQAVLEDMMAQTRASNASLTPDALPPAAPGPSEPTHAGIQVPPPSDQPAENKHDIEDDSWADSLSASGSNSVPRSWPVPPGLPTFNIGTPAPRAQIPVQTTPLATVRARAAAIREALQEAMPKPPVVGDELKGQERDLAVEAARGFEPSNADIMSAIGAMMKNMVVRDDIRADVAEALAPLQKSIDHIDAKSTQALDETKNLHQRTVTLETGAIQEYDRVGKVESELEDLRGRVKVVENATGSGQGKPSKHDVNFLRIAFRGFSTETLVERRATIKTFMETNFGMDVRYCCIDTRMQGPYGDKKPSEESFVQFASPESRDRFADEIRSKKYGDNVTSSKGSKLYVGKSRTEWQRQRDFAMRKSEELIKGKLQSHGAQCAVKYVKSQDERKITVNGTDAFVQRRTDARGHFCGEFVDLKFP